MLRKITVLTAGMALIGTVFASSASAETTANTASGKSVKSQVSVAGHWVGPFSTEAECETARSALPPGATSDCINVGGGVLDRWIFWAN